MNKLFKFAGVSALSLIVAAPNAFGAYGRFDAFCAEKNMKIVNFLTLNSSGKAKYNVDETVTVYYDVNSNKWCKDAACEQEYTKPYELLQQFMIPNATGLSVVEKAQTGDGTISISKGELTTKLISYGAMYLGSLDAAYDYVYPSGSASDVLPFQSLTTGSTCSFSAGNYAGANIIAPGSSEGSWAFNTSATTVLPTLVGTGSALSEAEQEAVIAAEKIYYIVRYAADCVSAELQEERHATCTLNIGSSGKVNYYNSCIAGCTAANGGFASPMDSGTCATIPAPTLPEAIEVSASETLHDAAM